MKEFPLVRPMLATLVDDPFHRPGWVYEEKYDGIRILAYKDSRRVQLFTRNLKERSADFPGVTAAVAALPAPTLVLDGEVVLLDAAHVSRFQLLQRRELGERTGQPIFAVFDCLYARGHDLRSAPLSRRRAVLEKEVREGDVLVLARRLAADGLQAFAEAARLGLEGVVAKNEASPYAADTRSRDWLKVKVRAQEEFVIGGFTAPAGSRTHFGALLVGAHRGGALRYAGKVGTGFTGRTLHDLMTRLQRLVRPTSPFTDHVRERGVTWVEPRLVAQIGFTELTGDGRLRHPAFLGLRTDKDPAQVRWPRALRTALVILALGPGLMMGGCATARSPLSRPTVPKVGAPEAPPPAVGFEQSGNASWYGAQHQGRRTASGELYDMTKLTAAHRTLPLGTMVRVTHAENGRSVEVRVNDRGPFVDGRVVDISRAAAERLGVLGLGVFPVKLRVVTLP